MIVVEQQISPTVTVTHASLPGPGLLCDWARARATPPTLLGTQLASLAPIETPWRHPDPGEGPSCYDCANRLAWLTDTQEAGAA